ncbi:hypothetical protein TNIN_176691 [Trichonephila inaurata madagascariensis]|uniref:Uncharacterized protein n=1 Tax=Trichonephila inaurata madagascariensis TaxID=2747483 RepID=A0A8X7CEU4_9ARAC|nr:hypothetical protein TNIN_176691 [Trichonephila inaurata madagascariensis]
MGSSTSTESIAKFTTSQTIWDSEPKSLQTSQVQPTKTQLASSWNPFHKGIIIPDYLETLRSQRTIQETNVFTTKTTNLYVFIE